MVLHDQEHVKLKLFLQNLWKEFDLEPLVLSPLKSNGFICKRKLYKGEELAPAPECQRYSAQALVAYDASAIKLNDLVEVLVEFNHYDFKDGEVAKKGIVLLMIGFSATLKSIVLLKEADKLGDSAPSTPVKHHKKNVNF